MKINIIRAILIILLLGTFFIIFGFSSQNGEESGRLSRRVTEIVTRNLKSVQKLEKEQKENVIQRIEIVIRKIAHFSIYMAVGLLLMSLLSTYKIEEINKIALSLIIGVSYASTDEIHQAFIPERAAQITDIMIDTMGISIGIMSVMLVIKLIKKYF